MLLTTHGIQAEENYGTGSRSILFPGSAFIRFRKHADAYGGWNFFAISCIEAEI
jgi:hypothetical protein